MADISSVRDRRTRPEVRRSGVSCLGAGASLSLGGDWFTSGGAARVGIGAGSGLGLGIVGAS